MPDSIVGLILTVIAIVCGGYMVYRFFCYMNARPESPLPQAVADAIEAKDSNAGLLAEDDPEPAPKPPPEQHPNIYGKHHFTEHQPWQELGEEPREPWVIYRYQNLCDHKVGYFCCCTKEEAVRLMEKLDAYMDRP